MIRLPAQAIEALSKLRGWAVSFEAEHGRSPTLEECSEYCQVKPERLQEYLVHSNDCGSLDTKGNSESDDGTSLVDLITDGVHGMDTIDSAFNSEVLRNYMAHLSDLDHEIITKFYGLDDFIPKTYTEISQEMGICRERARQRCHKAMNKLRLLSKQTKELC